MPESTPEPVTLQISANQHLARLDATLANSLSEFSRTKIKEWILSGKVLLDQTACLKPNTQVQHGQTVVVRIPASNTLKASKDPIALKILYENDDLLVLNKPEGLVVHPGAGQANQTLMNGLLYHYNLAHLPRAGIVHRLDKDTTGLMVIAKHHKSYAFLTSALAERTIQRRYLAIVDGQLKASQTIDAPIGRHSTHRQRMAISQHGKEARTHVKVKERLSHYTFVECTLDTGRTHQIRVHLQSIGHPLLGDPTYGRHRGYQQLPREKAQVVLAYPRQALHAWSLTIPSMHPNTPAICTTCPPPEDFQNLLDTLR